MSDNGEVWQGRVESDIAAEVQYRLVEELAESERRHRELLADLPDIVLRLGVSGDVRYVNDAWTSFLGHAVVDVIGSDVTSYILEGDRQKWAGLFLPVGADVRDEIDRVVRFHDMEGAVHWMSVRLRLLRSGEIVGSLEDVTMRRQLETELLRTQHLESIGRLAGGLAHDFNNLLTVILGNVNLAQASLAKKEIDLSELELAKRACDLASQLTKQMLTFSKGGEPIRRPRSLSKLVREAVGLALRGSSVRPVLSIDDTAAPVDMDASQIHQVINNLIINAEQAMPGGGDLRVRVREQLFIPRGADEDQSRAGVAVEIRDQGHGIPKDHLDQVFEPYFTTKETGNGLGLTSAYWILKRHGGLLEIESSPGAGTLVRVVLPLADRPIEVEEPIQRTDRVHRTGRVLVMDDDENVRNALVAMLESIGHEIVATCDGDQCLAAFNAAFNEETGDNAFDVVILDLTIAGGRDGVWAINRLRDIDPEVKAVVVSGYSNAPVMSDHHAHGFSAVLTKPFLIEDLERVVGDLVMRDRPKILCKGH